MFASTALEASQYICREAPTTRMPNFVSVELTFLRKGYLNLIKITLKGRHIYPPSVSSVSITWETRKAL
jgi:hypothetical protein